MDLKRSFDEIDGALVLDKSVVHLAHGNGSLGDGAIVSKDSAVVFEQGAEGALGEEKSESFRDGAFVSEKSAANSIERTDNFHGSTSNLSEGAEDLSGSAGLGEPEISDAALDLVLPQGYAIVPAPADYIPLRINANKSRQAPRQEGFSVLQESAVERAGGASAADLQKDIGELQFFKESDAENFGALMASEGADGASRQRRTLKLLLRIKNGVPAVRRQAMRQISDEAAQLGADTVIEPLLLLLKDSTLDPQERHLLVKVMGRILFQLKQKAEPFTHRLLIVVQPLLMDTDPMSRREGREAVAAIANAVGLKPVLTALRSDADHMDDYVRATTAECLAVTAQTLGIPKLIPFFVAASRSQEWGSCHTAIRSVQSLARLAGCGVLPHLLGLVKVVVPGLRDNNPRIRYSAATAISQLADASSPYGIEAFEPAMDALWLGVRRYKGKPLAGFLRALGSLVALMDPESSRFYTKRVLELAVREFGSPDDEIRRSVLLVIRRCCSSEGLDLPDLREALPSFFQNFWLRRLALDRRIFGLIIDATADISSRIGAAPVLERIVDLAVLSDPAESFRRMGLDTTKRIASESPLVDLPPRLEERLFDGLDAALRASEGFDLALVNCISAVVNAFGSRAEPFLPGLTITLLNSLARPEAGLREQSAQIVGRMAPVMKEAHLDDVLAQLGSVLYEQLGEEYPEVLAAVLYALRGIVSVVGLESMQPPIRDLLPRLTPILRNRHERVQEMCILLVGVIADRGAEFANAREWMRITFELLELFKAPRKSVRRAANDTFGYISKGIGPQDVLATLLTNLRVQERQSRVNTAVALGIVAETCEPFTVLPALLNEYRTPDMNVQHGVLKALSFMFEYIGSGASDYLYAVTGLVDHALTDKNIVSRQVAASAVKHLALDVAGRGYEDVMIHFLNELMPNVFETSPHVIDRVLDSFAALRTALGTGVALAYIWAGLFHPARKVRDVYWRMYNAAYVQSSDAMVPAYPVDVPGADVWI